jgi:hypothetical protein
MPIKLLAERIQEIYFRKAYSFSHFLFHEARKEIVNHGEDGRIMNVVHTLWTDGCCILTNN